MIRGMIGGANGKQAEEDLLRGLIRDLEAISHRYGIVLLNEARFTYTPPTFSQTSFGPAGKEASSDAGRYSGKIRSEDNDKKVSISIYPKLKKEQK